MKLLSLLVVLCGVSAGAVAQTYVQPYTDKNGTYHQGHYRSAPNNTDLDNYNTKGNYNPYTGETGTRTPKYEQPTYVAPAYVPPVYTPPSNNYGQQRCGYTSTGRYVCR
jgi:hypothetical protein